MRFSTNDIDWGSFCPGLASLKIPPIPVCSHSSRQHAAWPDQREEALLRPRLFFRPRPNWIGLPKLAARRPCGSWTSCTPAQSDDEYRPGAEIRKPAPSGMCLSHHLVQRWDFTYFLFLARKGYVTPYTVFSYQFGGGGKLLTPPLVGIKKSPYHCFF
jgi:hypothetical protein